jgi:polar amino acid transport system substrate-binding protein
VLVSLESRFSDLRDGKVDLLCGADTVTLKRREEVSFSIPVLPGGIGALVRSDSPATLQTVLEGRPLPGFVVWRGYPAQILHRKTFSAVAGSTAEPWLTERIATLGIPSKAVPVGTYDEGVASVLDRSSDVLFGDRAILLEAAAKNAAAGDLKVLDRHFTFESIALGVPRGDDDFRLLVDRTLNALYPTEAFAEIWEATFGEPDDRALLFFRANILPE